MHYASFLLYAPLLSGQRVSGKIKFAAAADWQVSVLQQLPSVQLVQPVRIVQCNLQLFLIQSRRTTDQTLVYCSIYGRATYVHVATE